MSTRTVDDGENKRRHDQVRLEFSVTLNGPVVCIKSGRSSLLGGPGGVGSVRIDPRKTLDMFSKGINTKYGTTSRDIRSLHLKAYSKFNARLSDRNRNRLEAYAPWKDSYVCTWSYRHRTLLEKEIPVTRDDGDESVLSDGPAMLDSSAVSAWWSESYTVFYPQTVRISYHGSRIVVTNV